MISSRYRFRHFWEYGYLLGVISFGNCNPSLCIKGYIVVQRFFHNNQCIIVLILLLTALIMMCKFHINVTAVKRFETLRIYVNSLDPVLSEYALAR